MSPTRKAKGPLTHGKIVATEGKLQGEGNAVHFMFNPTEYTITKANTWNLAANKSGNVPKWEFGGGEPRQLQLELFFDSYLPRQGVHEPDVRKVTNKLFNLMMIDAELTKKSPKSKMGQPPQCCLFWGEDSKDQFDCYITNCQVKYTLFNESGLPVRATATLTMKEVRDPRKLLKTNPTSGGDPGRHLYTVQEGDRMDWIAFQEYGDPGEWRRIAVANRIFNPLNLRAGMVLAIPPA